MFELNTLKRPDIAFFIICLVVIALIVLIYFLIPVFKHKQLKEQRQNLIKRESAFRSQIKVEEEENIVVEENKTEEQLEAIVEETIIETDEKVDIKE